MRISVVLPSHNPDLNRLRRSVAGLRAQSLSHEHWETILVDNASHPPIAADSIRDVAPLNLRIVREEMLGLSSARRRGFIEARGAIVVLVDDDNVLAPDYLEEVLSLFSAHPRIGILGGKLLPEFERTPAPWFAEFSGLLALRDLGESPLISNGLRRSDSGHNEYPLFAPMGAGMALRREAAAAWLELCRSRTTILPDRRGSELTSSGDNDIVLSAMRGGWEVAYFPTLSLIHLIPSQRLSVRYLVRLNYGIQKSWTQVLALHDACPWPALTRIGAIARKLKAWLVQRPWSSPSARIRWAGACGHFDGRVR